MKDIIFKYTPPPERSPVRHLSDAEILTMLNNGKYDPDADLVQKQHREHADGHIHATIQKNIYGWCLFDPYWGGRRISENFATKELAETYAIEWVAEDPKKHHFDEKKMIEGLTNYDEIITGFVAEHWGTVEGEEIYRKRRVINDDDHESIKKLYNYMVSERIE